MATYTTMQIRTLFMLRERLAEIGFDILHLKRSKHPEEFLAFRRQEAGNQEDNTFRAAPPIVLCRLFRGKVQIKFLEEWHQFTVDDKESLQKSLEKSFQESFQESFDDRISITERAYNPTIKKNCRTLKELVDQGELKALI